MLGKVRYQQQSGDRFHVRNALNAAAMLVGAVKAEHLTRVVQYQDPLVAEVQCVLQAAQMYVLDEPVAMRVQVGVHLFDGASRSV